MNKYTLEFKSADVELKYQKESIYKLLKPLHYGLILMSLLLNTIEIILVTVRESFSIPLINLAFIGISIFSFVIVYKKETLTQKMMTIENAYILLLQLNFTADNIHGQEYFLYGSSLSLIQAITYFSTDFYLSCPSVIFHLIFRLIVTSLYAKKFDLIALGLTITTAIFLISVLYICNRAQRLQFLLNFKEDTINYQLQTLINKPFTKIIYNEKKLQIDVLQVNQVNQFLGFNQDLCFGCNIRNFIRNCKISNRSLEKWIIDDQTNLKEICLAMVQRTKIKIRLSQFNTDNSLILILENSRLDTRQKQVPQFVTKQLVEQFMTSKKTLFNLQFKFGVMSILMLGQYQIKTVNIVKVLKKLLNTYVFSGKVNLNFNGYQIIKLKTYSQFLNIFLIQVFNIIQDMEYSQNIFNEINVNSFDNYLAFQLKLSNKQQFMQLYSKNFFIKYTEQHLLVTPLTFDLVFYFNKLIPFDDTNASL
ncbi:unnamed protein product (macronuclear) [Paramecium tetraurelia]|uniref:Transmembrane protein n=1 Tax=Paramecium tetraurelia TaxID=5888 RepID=A0DV34_PARTE|nr:uncharacterized protein GSPATT00020563001 [Paramecium tetraurelia]CAK86901.1 unnamed protein product [Paramecium tetraurelia]|eukprot:XP_001454298.1 hypothetical protein (macronuclear) [Paramecium tetraurelia strain d4-2]